MSQRPAVITVAEEGEPPIVHPDAVAYVVLTADGVLSNGMLSSVNPRVLANALQFVIDDLLALAEAGDVPPIDPLNYPRHR